MLSNTRGKKVTCFADITGITASTYKLICINYMERSPPGTGSFTPNENDIYNVKMSQCAKNWLDSSKITFWPEKQFMFILEEPHLLISINFKIFYM